jgi:hypothetical protein
MVPVYDGKVAIGFIARRGLLGAESFTGERESLGLFRTVDAAATALWKQAHGQPIKPDAAPEHITNQESA